MALPATKPTDTSEAWAFCRSVLPSVSRTFALTIPVLPKKLEESVCVAYLLCRIADTIEDRSDIELNARLGLYHQFLALVGDSSPNDQDVAAFVESWPADDSTSDYQSLMLGTGKVITAFFSLDRPLQLAIRDCVVEMVEGMQSMTHQPPDAGIIYVCNDLPELEHYCHYVAGTVGIMLTKLFATACSTRDQAFDTQDRIEQGRKFGLGLQLTNIIKDQQTDWQRGTSFFPKAWYSLSGKLVPLQRRSLILRTIEHLDEAQDYTLAIPPQERGIRLFCLWASWMAMGTLREAAGDTVAVPKISRAEVQKIITYTSCHAANHEKLQSYYSMLKQQTLGALGQTSSLASLSSPLASGELPA